MASTLTRKYLPQAVPRSTLSARAGRGRGRHQGPGSRCGADRVCVCVGGGARWYAAGGRPCCNSRGPRCSTHCSTRTRPWVMMARPRAAGAMLVALARATMRRQRCPLAPLTASVVVDTGLGKHGVVLDLGLAHGRAVVADDDQLACAGSAHSGGRRGSWRSTLRCWHSDGGRAAPAAAQRARCAARPEPPLAAPACPALRRRSPPPGRLTLAGAQSLQAGLVAQSVLATLHHQRQAAVDVLLALLLWGATNASERRARGSSGRDFTELRALHSPSSW